MTVDENAVQPVEVGCSRKAQQGGTTADAVSIWQSAGGSSMQEKGTAWNSSRPIDQEIDIRSIFQVTLRIAAKPRRSFEAVRALQSIANAAQLDHGFLAARIYQEIGNPEALCLEEDWSSEQALKSHMRSSSFTDLLRLMETAPEAPVLEVRTVHDVQGLEYVEAVRFGDR